MGRTLFTGHGQLINDYTTEETIFPFPVAINCPWSLSGLFPNNDGSVYKVFALKTLRTSFYILSNLCKKPNTSGVIPRLRVWRQEDPWDLLASHYSQISKLQVQLETLYQKIR